MALDTVCLRSPALAAEVAGTIEGKLDSIQRISNSTGEVFWYLTTKTLKGSHDSNISVKLVGTDAGRALRVEASIHKFLLGQNVYGNPEGFQERCGELVDRVAAELEVSLPAAGCWQTLRVDWAFAFDLGGADLVGAFFRGMRGCTFPRRKVNRYHFESFHIPGKVTTLKAYHKGPELRANGAALRKSLPPDVSRKLQELADQRLRVEVGIRSARLGRFSKCGRKSLPLVRDLVDSDFEKVYEQEVDRLLRERHEVESKIVRTHEAVAQRLKEKFGGRLCDVLYGFWARLSTQGEDGTRVDVARSTFYRRRKQLEGAGVSWKGTDVVDDRSVVDAFDGLTLKRTDPRRCTETVADALALMQPAKCASTGCVTA